MTSDRVHETTASVEDIMTALRADPALRRADRIAIAFAMQADGFAARDIARVASVRKGLIADIRRALDLPERARGAARTNRYQPDAYPAPRSLAVVVRTLLVTGPATLPAVAARLRISELSAYGVLRAMDYARALAAAPTPAELYRCPGCEQRSPRHPCAHCGHAWLVAA